ncbi:hypothetical protein JCM25156A_14720 [Komagataeibacter kakiaceti JCM 25156]
MSFSTMPRMLALAAILYGAGGMAGALAAPALVRAEPAAGQTVAAGNVAFRLSFDSVIDPFRARLLLLGPDGAPRLLPASPVDDEQQAISTTVALTPGHYVLHWRMRARGGDTGEGALPFDVGAPSSPVPAKTP